jgi:DNA-binding ferritin-like protein
MWVLASSQSLVRAVSFMAGFMEREGAVDKALAAPSTQELACALLKLAAWCKRLENQAHLAHVNYVGPDFLSVHSYLKGQYEEHLEQFDQVLELLRSLGYWAPFSDKDLMDLSAEFNCLCGTDGPGLLSTYRGNIEAAGNYTKEVEALATSARSIDAANAMAEISGQMWKAHWFLGATLGC